ncbi:sialin [Aplysia californica]|uniref:Sialin n=1 Tax=Aplysia californica TaxID=6500 RepID=A0ABM0ZZY3_APLCA|nr:sialin [Aplysia californica]
MPSYDVTDVNSPNGSSQIKTEPSGPLPSKTSNPRMSSPSSRAGRNPLEHQVSNASLRRRQFQRRQSSTFDFPHLDSVQSMPSLQLEELDLDAVPWWTSHRFRLALLCFLGFVSLYAQRVNLSIAIVSMVDHSTPEQYPNTSFITFVNVSNITTYNLSSVTEAPESQKCPEVPKSEKDTEFHWSKALTGLILGSFFWGYLVFQIPGGRLSETFGAKRVIAVAMFPVAVLNLLTPVVARASPYLFLVLRVFVGLGEGVMYPAAQALWSRWAPPNERSRLIGFSYAGGQFGNAIIFPIGGFLCAYGPDGGWPAVFYVIGGVGFIWCILWVIFAHDTPADSKSIGELEKKYIQLSLGERTKAKQVKTIPWRSLLLSGPVWGILVAHMCGNYGAYMLLTKIPAYMKEVLKFDIKSNGVYSMLPYLTFWFFITVSGTLADLLISRNILSVTWTRKVMSVIGTVGPACFLVGTGFMECDQSIGAVVMLTIAVGLCGFHFSGYFINHGDIAPPFAGTLFGITNTAATIPGILSPYVVAAMTPNGTRAEWQSAFYVAAAIYCFGAIWYVIFGSGEIQPWAKPNTEGGDRGDAEAGVGFSLQGIHEAVEEKEEEDEEEEEEEEAVNDKGLLSSTDVKVAGDQYGSLNKNV